ncbi:MAG: HNH endonuclease [Rhodobacter sp.]|nr:HNH endonuclease [Rhodobacter sp.]
MKFHLKPDNRGASDEELLSDFKRICGSLNKDGITSSEYAKLGRFAPRTLINRFGTWQNVHLVSGMRLSKRYAIPEEELFRNLVEVWRTLGEQPNYGDMSREPSVFSPQTYARRYGGWRKALVEFVRWADQTDSEEGLATPTSVTKKRTPRDISWRLRAKVLLRDGATCKLCGVSPRSGETRLHVDHVIPYSKGGETEIENLQILCEKCNIGKGDLIA